MTVSGSYAAPPDPGGSWPLWVRQTAAIVRLEWFRYFFGRRALPVWFLASMPVLLMLIRLDFMFTARCSMYSSFQVWIPQE